MKSTIIPIEKNTFFHDIVKRKMEGWRFSQMCAVTIEDGFELSYTFVKDLEMETLRLLIQKTEPITSITQIYPCAFLQENEAAELFGVIIEGITMDYKHQLYRIDTQTPFAQKGVNE